MLTWAGRGVAKLARTIASVVLAVVLLALAGMGALAWRLAERPLDVTWLATRIERYAAPAGTAVSLGRATVAWDGFHTGLGAPLRIALTGLQVQSPGHDPALQADGITAEIEAGRLLSGHVAARALTASGVQLHLRRDKDGTVGLDLGDAAQRHPDGKPGDGGALAQLDSVSLRGVQLDVDDAQLGARWQARDVAAQFDRHGPEGAAGTASLTLAAGDVATPVTASARSAGTGGVRLEVRTGPVNPGALARALPAAGALAAFDAPVTAILSAELDAAFHPVHATVHAEAGPGVASLPTKGGGTAPAAFASATLDADGDAAGGTLQGLTLVLASPSGGDPTALVATGTLTRADGRLRAPVTLTLDHVAFADLPKLWPPGTGGGARDWLTQNITAGTAHDGRFNLLLEAPEDLSAVEVTRATGELTGDDLTTWWLRPVPPLDHGHAVLTLLSPDVLDVAVTAREGAIQARQGLVHIAGLSVHDQVATINTDLTGPLPDVLTLLRHPRLKLLSAHPLPLNQPSGSVTGHLSIVLPLEQGVTFDQIQLHATAKISDTHLGGLVAGQSLDHGQLALDATNDGLKMTGTAELATMPASFGIDADFRAGPPTQTLAHAAVSIRGTERQLAATGLDAGGLLSGTVAAQIDYTQRRDGQAGVVLDAKLDDAAVTTPFGWSKSVGAEGKLHGRAVLDHGKLVGVEDLQADAPGLVIRSRTEIVDGRPAVLHLQQLVIGRTRATGIVSFPVHPGDRLTATLSGPELDLTGRLKAKPGSGGDATPSTPYAIDLRFQRVSLGPASSLGPLTLEAENDGRRFERVRLISAGPEQVRLTVTPAGQERRAVASVGDTGVLLRALDVTTDLDGGALTFNGVFDDRTQRSPLSGSLDMTAFKVRGAAAFGKILQGLTVYGILDALRGPGLAFDRLTGSIRLEERRLTIAGAHAYSSSLGVTADGGVDLGRDTLDLHGTIVPAYALNTLPGRIPLVGKLFSPERGGGVFATTYHVHGPLQDPSIGVNPLATLTPGVLRGIFGVFD